MVEVDPGKIIEIPKTPIYEVIEAMEFVILDPAKPERGIAIGAHIDDSIKKELIDLLHEFADIFAWEPRDMPGIPESIALHRLNNKKDIHLVK